MDRASKRSHQQKVDTVAVDVLKVEKATNSHTDLLVNATTAASHAEGKQEERNESRARVAEQAAGVAAEKAKIS